VSLRPQLLPARLAVVSVDGVVRIELNEVIESVELSED
jgi:hypothetical protein